MIQNKIEVYTYSERGIINSIIYELFYSNDYSKITAILDMIEPPMAIGKIINLKIFIEQSFSGFGDPDLIFLIKNEDKDIAIFIEAKVRAAKKDWNLDNQLKQLKKQLKKFREKKSEYITSNLFSQLYLKQRLFQAIKNNEDLNGRIQLPLGFSPKAGKLGDNVVVNKAFNMLGKLDDFYLVMLIPQHKEGIKDFFNELSNIEYLTETYEGFDVNKIHYLSFEELKDYCKDNLVNSAKIFDYNGEQIV